MLKSIKRNVLWMLPKKLAHTIIYYRQKGKKIDWRNPSTFDEKMHWLMVYEVDEKYAVYADKYKVREYIEKLGLSSTLIELYGVYDSYTDVDKQKLPDKFIMKGNNGSGTNYYAICEKKSDFNFEEEGKKIQNAISKNYSKNRCEYHYESIEPKIIIEEYLTDGKHERLIDYKFYCFDGIPRVVLACSERGADCKRGYYDMEWKELPYVKEEFASKELVEKPEKLAEMIEVAKTISKDFAFVRVDLYEVNGKVYFGEMTFTGAAGHSAALNEKGQCEMGQMMNLPYKER